MEISNYYIIVTWHCKQLVRAVIVNIVNLWYFTIIKTETLRSMWSNSDKIYFIVQNFNPHVTHWLEIIAILLMHGITL